MPKVEESAFSTNQFLFKLIAPKVGGGLTLAHFSSLQILVTFQVYPGELFLTLFHKTITY
jgi:hypothetical protein